MAQGLDPEFKPQYWKKYIYIILYYIDLLINVY
jgi:hypothetical protein